MSPRDKRRERQRRRSAKSSIEQTRAPYIQRKIDTVNVLSEEGLCLIEENADLILRDTGMEFQDDPEILKYFVDAGCDVKDTRVRFEPGFCRKTCLLYTSPSPRDATLSRMPSSA